MKFRFRLEPMLKVAMQRLNSASRDLVILRDRRDQLEALISETRAKSDREDQQLTVASDGPQAVMFYQRREYRQNELRSLTDRRHDFEQAERQLTERIAALKREVYRLEKVREKALSEHVRVFRALETKQLDESAVARYRSHGGSSL